MRAAAGAADVPRRRDGREMAGVTSGLRVLMTGGGTGGHLFPGLAVAGELRRRRPAARIVFAGTGRGAEASTVREHGFEHVLIRSAGLKGTSWRKRIRGLSVLPLSAWDAWRVIDRVAPQLVIGLGGYSAGAVVLLAALRRIPTMVLEQNVTPGVTNRLLARVVSAAAVSYDATLPQFRGKGFVAGNPVRAEFFEPAPASAPGGASVARERAPDEPLDGGDVSAAVPGRASFVQERAPLDGGDASASAPAGTSFVRERAPLDGGDAPAAVPAEAAAAPLPRSVRLLVLGGSQGAHAINAAMMAAAPALAGSDLRIAVTHQTGERDREQVQEAYVRAGVPARVAPFFREVADLMRGADVVVSRAGATTLAELAAAGRPSVLVPLPGAADGHQQANAEVLADRGAAEVLSQDGLSGERLAARVLALAADDERRRRMGAAARTLARPQAVSIIVDRAERLIGAQDDA